MHEDSKKHETPTDANNVLAVVLPPKEDILKEAEKQISDWLEGSTEKEKEHYRVAFRRSYEYIVRVTKK
jgi:hypothetical protein